MAEGNAPVLPEQPDGIETDSHDLPDPARAVQRIRAYVSAFGDGLYDEVDGNPLYGRDLEAVTRAVTDQRELADQLAERQRFVERLAVNVHDARIDRDRWRRIALRLALAGDGSYRQLSTEDRDVLEAGLAEYRQDARERVEESAGVSR